MREFNPGFEEITVNLNAILTNLGYSNGAALVDYKTMIEDLYIQSEQYMDLRCGYVVLPEGDIYTSNGEIHLKNSVFKTGKIISTPLKEMEKAALFVATIGPDFDKWSRDTFNGGDPLAGFIIDIIGSMMAEGITDWLKNKIVTAEKEHGIYVGWSTGVTS